MTKHCRSVNENWLFHHFVALYLRDGAGLLCRRFPHKLMPLLRSLVFILRLLQEARKGERDQKETAVITDYWLAVGLRGLLSRTAAVNRALLVVVFRKLKILKFYVIRGSS